jgi:hypothetical protein
LSKQAGGRLAQTRVAGLGTNEIQAGVRAHADAARKALLDIPERLRPAELFRNGQPLLGKLGRGRTAGAGAKGFKAADRELLTVGVPLTKRRARVPLPIPRKLESKLLEQVARPFGAAKRGLQRTFGRGIPESTRTVGRFFAQGVRKSAEQIGEEIAKRSDEFVAQRVKAAGGTMDDIGDAIREEFFTDIRNAREAKPGTVKKLLSKNEAEFVKDLDAWSSGRRRLRLQPGRGVTR